MDKLKKDWKQVRRDLHKIAELSGNEKKTSAYVRAILADFEPQKLLSGIGGHGILAEFSSGKPGKKTVIRAELDALPIKEKNSFSHGSITEGISHKCGHDGHMAVLLSLGEWLSKHIQELKGSVILLFQPAEETAAGAKAILADKRFLAIKPDYIFALHNIPGYEMGGLLLRRDVFAAASMGLKFYFSGKTSHAGHPENGNNPLFALQELLQDLQVLPQRENNMWESSLITIIHLKLGEEAFGTAPGEGVLMATLRAEKDEVLQQMAKEALRLAESSAKKYSLDFTYERVEEFAATKNNDIAEDLLERAAHKSGLPVVKLAHPFPWSEDFSFFSRSYKTAFFGLGSGKEQAQLHNPDYDFPDELILTGRAIFQKIIEEINNVE